MVLRAGVDAVVVDADVVVTVGGDLGLADRVDAVAGGWEYTASAWLCIVGSFGVGELTAGVKLAAGVAGCAGKVLAVVGAVCAAGGGVLAAAGPVSTGCVGRVEAVVGAVLVAVEIVPIDGYGCPGK